MRRLSRHALFWPLATLALLLVLNSCFNPAFLALSWRDGATADFLSSYFSAFAGDIRSSTIKLDQQLLDLFLLNKAFYEIAYEAANRPGWLSIPVRGVMELLRRRGIVP